MKWAIRRGVLIEVIPEKGKASEDFLDDFPTEAELVCETENGYLVTARRKMTVAAGWDAKPLGVIPLGTVMAEDDNATAVYLDREISSADFSICREGSRDCLILVCRSVWAVRLH